MAKESIALNPVVRPKNNQQFMAPSVPYWKTSEYKKMMAERRRNQCLQSAEQNMTR